MFAVIKTGGKQYRVQKGDILEIEKLGEKQGKKISFENVLLIEVNEKISIGTPYVKNAMVKAEILENFKDKKVLVFKKKRRKQYRRTKGHRQDMTRIRIEDILVGLKAQEKKPTPKKAKPSQPTVKTTMAGTEKKPARKTGIAKKTASTITQKKPPAGAQKTAGGKKSPKPSKGTGPKKK